MHLDMDGNLLSIQMYFFLQYGCGAQIILVSYVNINFGTGFADF